MSKLPKLKIVRMTEHPVVEETRNIEDVQYLLLGLMSGAMVAVEGQIINSYAELVQIAARDCYNDKEFLEVVVAPFPIGGG